MHTLKVEIYSKAEERLNDLFNLTKTTEKVSVRLGKEFKVPYNEYEFDDEVYEIIRNYLKGQVT